MRRMARLAISLFLLVPTTVLGDTVIFVDQNASGPTHDGASWCDAYVYLQDALLAAAESGGLILEIRVAQGTYRSDQGTAHVPGDREATFQLLSGVTIKGGYAGCATADPDERDVDVYETILSGDLNSDDGADFANNDENSYHVVTASGTNPAAILDGFAITGGNADGEGTGQAAGGGMYIHSGSPTVMSCAFRDNAGGRVEPSTSCCCLHDTPGCGAPACEAAVCAVQPTCCTEPWDATCISLGQTFSKCWLLCNPPSGCLPWYTGGGAAMYNENGAPLVTHCTFTGNISDAHGGGILSRDGSPTVENCVFAENTSAVEGGGIYSDSDVNLTLTNCAFTENTADESGGGIFVQYSSATTLDTCTFSGNEAGSSGGGAHLWSSPDTILIDCQFVGNHAALLGGGLKSTLGNPTFIACLFTGNTAGFSGGALHTQIGSLTMNNCTIADNTAGPLGGGGVYTGGVESVLAHCAFNRNASDGDGGAMHITGQSSLTLTNCAISGNSSTRGGGMYSNNSAPTLINCILNANSASEGGGAVYSNGDSDIALAGGTFLANFAPAGSTLACDSGFASTSSVTVVNSILSDGAGGIWNNNESTITITYSAIQGSWPGAGNIDTDPLFIDADGPDDIPGTQDDDLRLSPCSPAIDAGDNTGVSADTLDLDDDGDADEPIPIDFDHNPRFVDDAWTQDTGNGAPPVVDMGAYEFQGNSTECCGNGIVEPGEECDDDTDFCLSTCAWNRAIPTVSEWGILAMTLLFLGAGGAVIAKRRRLVAA